MDEIIQYFLQLPLSLRIVVGTWLVITIGNSGQRNSFMENTFKLLTEPSEVDKYPDKKMEKITTDFKEALVTPIKNFWDYLKLHGEYILKNNDKWKLVGQFVMLMFLFFFFVADAIAISSGATVLGYPIDNVFSAPIQNFLGQYGVAITGGTFFSILTAGFVMLETFGVSKFSTFGDDASPKVKEFVKVVAIFLMASSLFSGIAFGFGVWSTSENMPEWLNGINVIVEFCANILVRANVLISTILIFSEAIQGLLPLLLVLIGVALLITGILFIVANVVASFGPMTISWIYKILVWLFLLFTFLISAPIEALKSSPKDLVSYIRSIFGK